MTDDNQGAIMMPDEPNTIWNEAIEAAARVVETNQEKFGGQDGTDLMPRREGNIYALAYAVAIRKLKREFPRG